ncbi:MAG: hypothetical protein M3619_00745 [Myxococcota bacterium]|nr:hypothetical protein [Myxococcota bacterium]
MAGQRAVDVVGEPPTEAVDVDLLWWLVKLGIDDRELYRRLRSLSWELAISNPDRSENPKKLS